MKYDDLTTLHLAQLLTEHKIERPDHVIILYKDFHSGFFYGVYNDFSNFLGECKCLSILPLFSERDRENLKKTSIQKGLGDENVFYIWYTTEC